MDDKRAAHRLYLEYLKVRSDFTGTYSFDQEQNILECREKIRMIILQFLCTCLPQERFKFPEFPNLILQSASMEFFEPIKAAEAFCNLESYISLLCIMPWKQEFHQIKKYGGFYQTKIASHLKNADIILKLVGFNEVSTELLVLTQNTEIELLQFVAFECFVASNECRILENIWSRVFDRGLNITNVVQIRQQNRGSGDEIVLLIESKYGKSLLKVANENVADSRKIQQVDDYSALPAQALTDKFRNKLEKHLEKAKKLSDFEDIPFIDEGAGKENEYTPIDLDEQILASLQLVEGKDTTQSRRNDSSTVGLKASQEWSFVREGLAKCYGEQYFEGPRKDILEKEPEIKPHVSKEGKYVKVYAEKPDPGYVNTDVARQLKKDGELKALNLDLNKSPMFCESKDSDYVTASSRSAYYPPTLEDSFSQPMRSRGVPGKRQVTDTVITKAGSPYYQTAGNRYAKTAPILRRAPVEEVVYFPHQTHPPYQQALGNENLSHSGNVSMDNIKKYQKRVSAPLISREKIDPIQFLPAVTSAPALSAARSYNNASRRNTTDGIAPIHVKTIHNIPQNNIAVQGDLLTEQTQVNPQWACPFCTFFNSPLTDICEMCSKSRDPNIEIDSPPCAGHSSRICGQCTLENEKDSVNCHACGHLLKGTQTVV